MFLKFFRTSVQGVYFFILIFTLILWLPLFKHVDVPMNYEYFYHSLILSGFFDSVGRIPWLSSVFSFLVLIFLGFYISRINFRHTIVNQRTELPAFFFITIALCAPVYYMSSYLLGIIPCIIALDRMMAGYRHNKNSFSYFDSGILLSVGSMIEIRLIWLIALLWISLIILRSFRWREWIFGFTGLALPYLFYISFYYLQGRDITTLIQQITLQFEITEVYEYSKRSLIPIMGIGFIFLFANSFILLTYNKNKIQSRKYFYFLFGMFITLGGMYLIPAIEQFIFLLLAIPLSFLFSYYFSFVRLNMRNEFLFLIFVLSLVLPRFF